MHVQAMPASRGVHVLSMGIARHACAVSAGIARHVCAGSVGRISTLALPFGCGLCCGNGLQIPPSLLPVRTSKHFVQ